VIAAPGLLARLFVAPPPAAGGDVEVAIDALLAPAAAVVGRGRRAVAAGCAIGLVLARRRGVPAALICVRGGEPGPAWRAAPGLGARRLAAAVIAAGAPALAGGRLVIVDLEEAPALAGAGAAARAERAAGAAEDAPTILVLAGPREGAFDLALTAQDGVAVACAPGDPPGLADLALAGLPAGAVSLGGPIPRVAAALAVGGLVVMPSLAATVSPLLEALS
jgi:hypothetical protein